MMTRKTQVLLLLFACIVISLQPIALSGTTYWDVSTDWTFYSGTESNSGPLTFGSPFTTTQIQIEKGLVEFKNFNMGSTWNKLGFHTPQGATMQVQSVSSNVITCNVDPGAGLKTWKIYVGSKELPYSVTGADYWSYWIPTQTVSISSDNIASVSLSWARSFPGSPPLTTATGFLGSLETNFITGIIELYTDLMGPVFWVAVSLVLMLPLQNRIGLLPIALIALQIWGVFVYVLPSGALNVGMAIIVLAGSSMLTILLFARRRQYG